MKKKLLVLAPALVSVPLYAMLVGSQVHRPDADYILKFLIISQLVFLLYLLVLFFSRRLDLFGDDRMVLWSLIAVALIIRIVVLTGIGQESFLSDDVFRYVWEGKMVVNGYNPFILSPDDMYSSGLVDTVIYPRINHPWLPTIYPPLSQYSFALSYLIGGDSLWGFKGLSLLFDLIVIAFVIMLVGKEKLPGWTLLIYLLSPLVVLEFIFSNHLDVLAIPFFLAALLSVRRHNAVSAGIWLALAASIKLFAIFCLPVFFVHFGGRERLKFAALFAGVFLGLYVPFLTSAGLDAFGSLWTYLGDWQFNGSIFSLLKGIFGNQAARIVCGGLFVSAVLGLTLWRHRQADPLQRSFWIFAVYIMLTPALFSWYLVWLLPFLILKPRLPFLLFTGTVLLSYHVKIGYYNEGVWIEHWYLRLLEYLPLYGLLAFQTITLLLRQKRGLA